MNDSSLVAGQPGPMLSSSSTRLQRCVRPAHGLSACKILFKLLIRRRLAHTLPSCPLGTARLVGDNARLDPVPGQPGHLREDNQATACRLCGQYGHRATVCPFGEQRRRSASRTAARSDGSYQAGSRAHRTSQRRAEDSPADASAGPSSSSAPGEASAKRLMRSVTTAADIDALLDVHHTRATDFNPIHYSGLWVTLRKLAKRDKDKLLEDRRRDGLELVCEATASAIAAGQMPPRGLSNILHAMAAAKLSRAEPCNRVWAECTSACLKADWNEYSAHSISNITWAFAHAGGASAGVFSALAPATTSRLHDTTRAREFTPQGLSNIAWAFAAAGHSAPPLFDALAEVAADRLPELNEQELTNVAWAFATTGCAAPRLMDAIYARVLGSLGSYSPQGIANISWAFAKLGHPAWTVEPNGAYPAILAGRYSPPLLTAVRAQLTARKAASLKLVELSALAWAFGSAGPCQGEGLQPFATLGEEFVQRLASDPKGADGQSIANLSWAFAVSRRDHPQLMANLADFATCHMSIFSARDLANLVWSFSRLGHVPVADFPAFYTALLHSARPVLDQLSPLELANLTWALSAADPPESILTRADARLISARVATVVAQARVDASLLSQFHQWQLWLDESGHQSANLPPSVRDVARAAFTHTTPTPSGLQRLIAADLRSLERVVRVEEEVRLPHGHSVDFIVEHVDAGRVAIEIDGPSHFLAGGSRKPTGATSLKRRQLRHFGVNLVTLPYWEIETQTSSDFWHGWAAGVPLGGDNRSAMLGKRPLGAEGSMRADAAGPSAAELKELEGEARSGRRQMLLKRMLSAAAQPRRHQPTEQQCLDVALGR